MSGGYFAGPYFGGDGGIAVVTPVVLGNSDEALQRQRIIAAIQSIVSQGPFYMVTYDAAGVPTRGEAVTPEAVIANEVSTRFTPPVLNRRARLLERTSWPFACIVQFGGPNETTVEEWENRHRTPIVLPQATDVIDGRTLRQCNLLFQDARYVHPPRGGDSPTGTRVVINYEAELAPI